MNNDLPANGERKFRVFNITVRKHHGHCSRHVYPFVKTCAYLHGLLYRPPREVLRSSHVDLSGYFFGPLGSIHSHHGRTLEPFLLKGSVFFLMHQPQGPETRASKEVVRTLQGNLAHKKHPPVGPYSSPMLRDLR